MCADMQLQEGCRRTIAAAIRASCERYAPLRHYKETAEDIRVIRLAMMVGAVSLRDQFEWDINNPTNSPEMFARSMCVDLGLPREFEVSIAAAIRAQVQEYRLAALQGRAIGRSVSAGFALRSDKELPAWTPQLSVQKDLRRRVQEPLTAGAPAASGMLSTTSLRPRGVTSGQMQMLTPESFRRDGGGGAGSQSSSNKVGLALLFFFAVLTKSLGSVHLAHVGGSFLLSSRVNKAMGFYALSQLPLTKKKHQFCSNNLHDEARLALRAKLCVVGRQLP